MYNDIYVTPKIYSGENCVLNNGNVFSSFGNRCLIVTGKASALKSGALADVECVLKEQNIEFTVFDGVAENPLVSTVIKAGECARSFGADFIVGIGGGSALDAAKAVGICAANPELDIDGLYIRQVPSKALCVILVGTTSGTGSEITGVSVLTNDNTMQKKSIGGADCYGAVAFCDAKYTYSMSYDVTVTTALDAFAHATEGYFSPRCNDYARFYAEKALPLIFNGLKTLCETEKLPGKSGRDDLYLGSLYAGFTLNVCGAAYPHTVGYVLTEEFGVPHGKACTSFTEDFLNRAKKNDIEKFHKYLRAVGYNEFIIKEVIKKLADVKINATAEDIKGWCSRWENGVIKNFNNTPGGFTAEDAEKVLLKLK